MLFFVGFFPFVDSEKLALERFKDFISSFIYDVSNFSMRQCMFFCVTLEILKSSRVMLLNPLKISDLRRDFLWKGGALDRMSAMKFIVLLSYSSLQITIVGVSCAWLVVAVVLCWEEISWRYFRVADDSFEIWYLTFHKVDCPISKTPSI